MEPNNPVEDDEETGEGSLGPKRWSKVVDEDGGAELPTCFLFAIVIITCCPCLSTNEQNYSMIDIS